jgi:hypothetical protein
VITINPFQANLPQSAKANRQVNQGSGKFAGKERLIQMRNARRLPRVRVVPTRSALRNILVHPNGMKFRREGSVEWPLDTFTQRRLRDGDIRIVEDVKPNNQRVAARPQQAQSEHSSRRQTGAKGETPPRETPR